MESIYIYIFDLLEITVTAKLICVFVFAYAKCLFSHDANQIIFRYPYICMDFTRDNSHTYFLRPCPVGIDMTQIHIFDTKT